MSSIQNSEEYITISRGRMPYSIARIKSLLKYLLLTCIAVLTRAYGKRLIIIFVVKCMYYEIYNIPFTVVPLLFSVRVWLCQTT